MQKKDLLPQIILFTQPLTGTRKRTTSESWGELAQHGTLWRL